jgi:hypothetical protein
MRSTSESGSGRSVLRVVLVFGVVAGADGVSNVASTSWQDCRRVVSGRLSLLAALVLCSPG